MKSTLPTFHGFLAQAGPEPTFARAKLLGNGRSHNPLELRGTGVGALCIQMNLYAEHLASSAQHLIDFEGALYSLALFEVRADMIAVGSANHMKKRAKGFRLT
jgi:hypothetical protein